MVNVSVEITEGATHNEVRVSAPSIERALALAGAGKEGRSVRVLFPIDAQAFFAPEATPEGIDYATMSIEEIEDAREANLPGAHEAFLDALRDDPGEEGFEAHALENCLV